MFGDFLTNFGLNAFPWDSLDPQGGLFGANAPQSPLIGSHSVGTAAAVGPAAPMAAPPGGGPAFQGSPPIGVSGSPLSPGASSPFANPGQPGGQGAPNPQGSAPAAGVGSPFGAPLQ